MQGYGASKAIHRLNKIKIKSSRRQKKKWENANLLPQSPPIAWVWFMNCVGAKMIIQWVPECGAVMKPQATKGLNISSKNIIEINMDYSHGVWCHLM